MTLTKETIEFIIKKLEYTFKKSDKGKALINRLKEDINNQDVELIVKKLEYRFKNSEKGKEFIKKLVDSQV